MAGKKQKKNIRRNTAFWHDLGRIRWNNVNPQDYRSTWARAVLAIEESNLTDRF